MRIAAVVIIYYPVESVLTNISSFANNVETVWVYDNSEQPNEYGRKLSRFGKVVYFSDKINEGISKRLNEAADKAMKEGFEYLLCMDQDSYFSDNNFEKYLSYIEAFDKKDQTVVWGIKFYGQSSLSSPDENLFIDLVDKEYCLRAMENNLLCIRINEALLHHQLGKEIRRASIKSLYLVKKKKSFIRH